MNKLTKNEEREFNHLKKILFNKKSFLDVDFISNQLLLNRYNELANKKTQSILTKVE
tara:strand:- start:4179 stop:4349 length:171 start_codon:yes stop_codon:yes gene_type:complete